jgi:hypothetical protein
MARYGPGLDRAGNSCQDRARQGPVRSITPDTAFDGQSCLAQAMSRAVKSAWDARTAREEAWRHVATKTSGRGQRTRGRPKKFPGWIEYANATKRFQEANAENLLWAEHLIETTPPDLHFELMAAELLWRQLQPHQPRFHALVGRLAADRLPPEDLKGLAEHDLPLLIEVKAEAPTQGPLSNQDYMMRGVAKEPIDCFYGQLFDWLEQDTREFVRKCVACGRFFVQRTASPDPCSAACRRQVEGKPRRQNAERQRRYRQAKLEQDLARVREAKVRWREHTDKPLELSVLLADLGMSRRRWAMLQQAERKRGDIQITDLTQ